jgi:hypothetical protein
VRKEGKEGERKEKKWNRGQNISHSKRTPILKIIL